MGNAACVPCWTCKTFMAIFVYHGSQASSFVKEIMIMLLAADLNKVTYIFRLFIILTDGRPLTKKNNNNNKCVFVSSWNRERKKKNKWVYSKQCKLRSSVTLIEFDSCINKWRFFFSVKRRHECCLAEAQSHFISLEVHAFRDYRHSRLLNSLMRQYQLTFTVIRI